MNKFCILTDGSENVKRFVASLVKPENLNDWKKDNWRAAKMVAYKYLNLNDGDLYQDASPNGVVISLSEVVKAFENKKRATIVLNKDYNAIIDSSLDYVAVGCQQIPNKAIRELNAKLIEFNCP